MTRQMEVNVFDTDRTGNRSSGRDDMAWAIEELAKWGGLGGLGSVFIGSTSAIADILRDCIETGAVHDAGRGSHRGVRS